MFSLNNLGFVDELELVQGWNNITLTQIEQYRSELVESGVTAADLPELFNTLDSIIEFTKTCGVIKLNPDPQVLSVIADENGIAENAFGPGIWAMTDADGQKLGALALSFGQDQLPLTIKSETDDDGETVFATVASVGKLKADIEFHENENKVTGKEWVSVSAEFFVNKKLVPVAVVLEKDLDGVTKAHLKAAWKSGDFAQYVRTAGAGSDYMKLKELGVGEYSLVDLWENPTHEEYGRSWSLRLEGVPAVVKSGSKRFEATLANLFPLYKKRLSEGRPQSLVISSKTELKNGAIVVVAAILNRAPNERKLAAAAKPVTMGALKSAAVEVVEDDDIPF